MHRGAQLRVPRLHIYYNVGDSEKEWRRKGDDRGSLFGAALK